MVAADTRSTDDLGFVTNAAAPPDSQRLVSRTNAAMQAASLRFWGDVPSGLAVATKLLEQFSYTARSLEQCGWSNADIRAALAPSRRVLSSSTFLKRCQEWPRGYAGDFETIEYLIAGSNKSTFGTIGWHFENIILRLSPAQQHRNKLAFQSKEILRAAQQPSARILLLGCGGSPDLLPVLPSLEDFQGEIVLQDRDLAALKLSESRLGISTNRYRLIHGNAFWVAANLAGGSPFDLISAGGVFDYLSDRVAVSLIRNAYFRMLKPNGSLTFTNIVRGYSWRPLLEYGLDWFIHERSEEEVASLCLQAGIPRSSLTIRREASGLAVLAQVVKGSLSNIGVS